MTAKPPKPPADAYTVSTVERAIAVIRAFTAQKPELGLADTAAIAGLDKATALRLLTTLCRGGLVRKNAATGLYRLGFDIIALAEIAKAPNDVLAHARPYMRAVRDRLNETVVVAIRAGDHRINLEQLEGLRDVRRVVMVGVPKRLYVSASSKILLAAMTDEEIADYLARTDLTPVSETTITDPKQLLREIETIRRSGFAEAVNEGNSDGAAISAPVRDRSGDAVAAFTITVPVSRFNKTLRRQMIDEVTRAADAISRELGALPDLRRA